MDLKPIEKLKPFQKFCMTIGELPVSYLESMTYLEMVMWFLNFLQETVIPTVNNNAEAVEELQTLFVQLHDYVENYFNNLDVQEEINNKLDTMASDGTLDQLLLPYFNAYKNEINQEIASQNNRLNLMNNKINALESGSPLVASSVSDMTDTSRVYVNTTNGKWYYYDGSEWTIGGTYQASEDSDTLQKTSIISESNNSVISSELQNKVIVNNSKSYPIYKGFNSYSPGNCSGFFIPIKNYANFKYIKLPTILINADTTLYCSICNYEDIQSNWNKQVKIELKSGRYYNLIISGLDFNVNDNGNGVFLGICFPIGTPSNTFMKPNEFNTDFIDTTKSYYTRYSHTGSTLQPHEISSPNYACCFELLEDFNICDDNIKIANKDIYPLLARYNLIKNSSVTPAYNSTDGNTTSNASAVFMYLKNINNFEGVIIPEIYCSSDTEIRVAIGDNNSWVAGLQYNSIFYDYVDIKLNSGYTYNLSLPINFKNYNLNSCILYIISKDNTPIKLPKTTDINNTYIDVNYFCFEKYTHLSYFSQTSYYFAISFTDNFKLELSDKFSSILDDNNKNPLFGKSAVFFGDSWCAGSGDATGGWASWLKRQIPSMDIKNCGRYGATWSQAYSYWFGTEENYNTIDREFDYIIIQAYTNGLYQSLNDESLIPLGTIDEFTFFHDIDEIHNAYGNTQSYYLERFLFSVVNKWKGKKIALIFPYKAFTFTAENNSFRAFRANVIKCCNKYSIPILDNFNSSDIPVTSQDMIDEFFWVSPDSTPHGDGTHLNAKGNNIVSNKIMRFMMNL